MSEQLIYDPDESDPDVFVDPDGNAYWPGEREVPDAHVEPVLNHPVGAWHRPDDAMTDDVPISPTPAPAADASADAEDGDGGDDATFDAEEFIDDSWQSVQAAIEDGEADGHLDAVAAAERNRENGPRKDSIIEAIENRADQRDAE